MSAPRPSRARRALAGIAAAALVVLLPTACSQAVASTPGEESASYGHGGHGGHGAEAPVTEAPEEEAPDAPDGETPEEDADATELPDATDLPDAEEDPADPPADGLEILGDDCSNSGLDPHVGLQEAPRCVSTAFGEVAAADQSPSLLITGAPTQVGRGEAFTLTVSTRNLVRDRFLAAADGGYYRESSFLNDDGIQRGHFHTACRMLPDPGEAPDAEPAPLFFLATQDNGGGPGVSSVEVEVTGLDATGTAQCAVWAGDGSHRVPMMQRANQTPAFDAVRITIG